MIILGIETSCDDTAISIISVSGYKTKPVFKILSNIVSSQNMIHQEYGGVYPMLAKREHQKNLPIVFQEAFEKAKNPNVDLIAVTEGPGLEPCLWQGINFAKELSKELKIKTVPINHIEAHIFANLIDNKENIKNLFPSIALIVSGGHTQLILIKDLGKYKIIGETKDDAAGECLDKTARILGLEYPGGPAIEKMAEKFKEESTIQLPRPMIYKKNYNFSFSGLKTAVLYFHKNQPKKIQTSEKYIQEISKEIQNSVLDVLIKKTIQAAENYSVRSIILGGGVTANKALRKRFKYEAKLLKIKLLIPKKKLSTDNAVMVALMGYFKSKTKFSRKIEAKSNLRI
ncbi:MAG: tRNA (adenosine(37)-N6)-threonylcarbamoyltransferase complex transferase subunit TsaD [Patescibacteria group bacterium]